MAMTALLLVASLLLLPTTGQAQETTIRRLGEAAAHPHGLPFESPLSLSPAAYEFFHPSARAQRAAAGAPALAPRGQPRGAGVSAASVARADHEEGGVAPPAGGRPGGSVRAGVVAGVFAGAAVVVLAALGLAYAVARRRVGVAHGGGDAEAPEAEAAGAAKSGA